MLPRIVGWSLLWLTSLASAAEPVWRSHPPQRPLPVASQRPRADGPARFVDPLRGDDAADGSESRPWRTIAQASARLAPGDTLYLRGGIYREHVAWTASGMPGRPISLRAFPGELAILDGGLAEFFETPATAWEPCPEGVAGEFRSTKSYPDLGGRADETNVLGLFGDSCVPLHGYRFRADLRSTNPFWNVANKTAGDDHVYCGPGLFYDVSTGRIHVRLAPTKLSGLGDDNYRGESDPRKLPLVVAGRRGGSPLMLDGVRHVRVQDLVVRGARVATIHVRGCRDIELDGVTAYGGSAPIEVDETVGLRVRHTACRGLAAPWTFRGSLKYRAIESRLFSASEWSPTGAEHGDFELAWCEFTDSVDGVFLGNAARVRFHHNFLDNVSDDGVFLTAATGYDGHTPGGDVWIGQNLFARCLTTFAFGVGHGRQRLTPTGRQTGSGAYIFRNVFDYRRPAPYYWPTGPDAPQEITSYGRFASDHGSPAWEPLFVYHNTIVAGDPPRYSYGTDGLGSHLRVPRRRVLGNIISQLHGLPGQTIPPPESDWIGDGNLFWSVSDGATFDPAQLFVKFRRSAELERSRANYAAGWTTNDRFADPRFVRFARDWRQTLDLRLASDSPALDAGVPIDAAWPDPLRGVDAGRPDCGALPRGTVPWRVGVHGRLSASGEEQPPNPTLADDPFYRLPTPQIANAPPVSRRHALLVQGYPAFDAPLIAYALRRRGWKVELREREWVDPRTFAGFDLVVYDGSLARAGIMPTRFSGDDLPRVTEFVERGGTLWLTRERTDLFASDDGQRWLAERLGPRVRPTESPHVLRPDHPWLKHLGRETPEWLAAKNLSLVATERGERLIGTANSAALLRVPLGRGQLVYLGWSVAAALPNGRLPTTLEQESAFDQQMRIVSAMCERASDE